MDGLASCIHPYMPPRLSTADAALMRGLARRRSIPVAGGLQIRLADPPETVTDPVVLQLATPQGVAQATVPQACVHHLLGQLDPAALQAEPHWVPLLLELAIETWLDTLGTQAPSLAFTIAAGQAPDMSGPFALGLEIGGQTIRLDFGTALAEAVVVALKTLPDVPRPLPGLAFPLHLRALATAMPLAEWRGARVGDVVLADALPYGEVLVAAGEIFTWRAQREATRLIVTTPRQRATAIGLGDWVMQDDRDAAGEPDGGLGDLPVRLAFELGRLELTLDEMQAIGPGHVFELTRAEEEAVDIVANGRRVGRGRIVSVAGAVGVQIVRLGA